MLVLAGLAMPVLIGMGGLAIEGANWYQTKRELQNAADTAATAAATNGKSSYVGEARAVTAQYGFTHGVNGTTIEVSNTAICPDGGSPCYSVTISRPIPIVFAQVVGFTGNTTLNGANAVSITSTAVAKQGIERRKYCVMALDAIGTAILSNGAPKADLSGCNIVSNSNMRCNGHDLKADHADAVGVVDDCGVSRTSNIPPVSDPYKNLAGNIPRNSCGSPAPTNVAGTQNWTGTKTFCGDLNLTGDVTLTGDNVVIVIENGSLNLDEYVLRTASGKTATIIFTGNNSFDHQINGKKKGAVLDIRAPDSGIWKGIAIYYDPSVTENVDLDYNGNTPSLAVTGAIYMPNSNVSFGGAVGKFTSGTERCTILVVKGLQIHGTAAMLSQDCEALGFDMPTGSLPGRGILVD
ncbi:pilus assembly protein TadG-related protein [Blastomonas sp.]|uniref:pilus assembly protein TadG-related protein n=1 Tax=Blastomonas sp. TaxID=1909299 RepID=UPI003592ECC4